MTKYFIPVTIFLFIGSMGCTSNLKFPSKVPGSPVFTKIKKIALNNVRIYFNDQELKDHSGMWGVKDINYRYGGTERSLRDLVTSNLKKFSQYEIYLIDEYNGIIQSNPLKKLRPSTGEKSISVDALLNLEFRIYTKTQEGSYDDIMTLSTRSYSDGKKTSDTSRDQVVNYPYSSKTVSVDVSGEFISLLNGEYTLLNGFNDSYVISFLMDGRSEHPSFDQSKKSLLGSALDLFSSKEETKEENISSKPLYKLDHKLIEGAPPTIPDIVVYSIVKFSNKILPNFSDYEVTFVKRIDTSGDAESVKLLEEGKVVEALTLISTITSKEEGKNASNLYNLGLCYDALGESRIAMQYYKDALALKGDEIYIEALGSTEYFMN